MNLSRIEIEPLSSSIKQYLFNVKISIFTLSDKLNFYLKIKIVRNLHNFVVYIYINIKKVSKCKQ